LGYTIRSCTALIQPADHNEAIRLDPKFARAYKNRADDWHEKGDLDQAVADYDEAIRLNPKYASAYSGRGDAWRINGDIERAIADYNAANQLDP
jgi:tetratricopeptide (TPR) repeat protein